MFAAHWITRHRVINKTVVVGGSESMRWQKTKLQSILHLKGKMTIKEVGGSSEGVVRHSGGEHTATEITGKQDLPYQHCREKRSKELRKGILHEG